jgi:hypothetical protein
LAIDLANDDVADYNWITPNQYNDMHSGLTGGYKGLTGAAAKIKQGDDFLSQIIPVIMASDAYKKHGDAANGTDLTALFDRGAISKEQGEDLSDRY